MTKLIYGLLFASLLAACGGGSSNGGPIPNPGPSNNPPAYKVSIVVKGGANTLQGQARVPQTATMASTPAPVMLGSAPFASFPSGYSGGISGNDVTVEAQVSPAPSQSPAATFTTTTADAQFTSLPSPVPNTQQLIDTSPGVGQGNQTITATVPSLGIQTTRGLNIYTETFLFYSATKSTPSGMSNGIAIQSGKLVATNAGAGDVYLDGNGNLVIPGGAISINGDTLYCDLAPSQWSSSYTTIALNAIATQQIADGSLANQNIIFKAADGEVGKMAIVQAMPGNGGGDEMLETFVQVAGHSIDGF